MRDEQQRTPPAQDARRIESRPARAFARQLECGGDGRTASTPLRAAWPAGRAPGAVREGSDDTSPDDAPDAA